MEMGIKERLNYVRKSRKMNQDEFGKRIGVTRSAVCNYESGTRPIGDQVILAVCREFNVAESWLRYGIGTMEPPKDEGILGDLIRQYNCTKFEGDFLHAYFQMSEQERMEFVKAMYRLFSPLMERMTGKNPFSGYFDSTYGISEFETQNQKVADAEAAYEKNFGFVSNTDASASSIIGDTGFIEKAENE